MWIRIVAAQAAFEVALDQLDRLVVPDGELS
jgi:hypothetical protein